MLDIPLRGGRSYWGWITILLIIISAGFATFLVQYHSGLRITGMGRDVSWGLYIGQLAFFVGVAASGVMVVLPYYLHDHKTFGPITILGEFIAIPAIVMCGLFVMVDLGNLPRMVNILLHPNPTSIQFWDMLVLNGYMILNGVIGWNVLAAEQKGVTPPRWVKGLIYLSIPWAFSIHTVTAFLFSGLPGRHYWLTAILAARFLASAFCAGPAILLLLCMVVRRATPFDPGKKALRTLGGIVAYAMTFNVFFYGLEVFTAYYSRVPGHMHAMTVLWGGHGGLGTLAPWMWVAAFLALVSLTLLLVPHTRRREGPLVVACVAVVVSTWIDKGLALIVGGFTPNPFGGVVEYAPTPAEWLVTAGIWATGALILTVLFKMAIGVKATNQPPRERSGA